MEEEGPNEHAPSNSHPFLGEDSEVAQQVDSRVGLVGDLLLQHHQEMDTKMLERAATTPQTEQGKIPLLLNPFWERETQFRFFFSGSY